MSNNFPSYKIRKRTLNWTFSVSHTCGKFNKYDSLIMIIFRENYLVLLLLDKNWFNYKVSAIKLWKLIDFIRSIDSGRQTSGSIYMYHFLSKKLTYSLPVNASKIMFRKKFSKNRKNCAPGSCDHHLGLPGGASKTISTGLFSITGGSSGWSGSGSGIGSDFWTTYGISQCFSKYYFFEFFFSNKLTELKISNNSVLSRKLRNRQIFLFYVIQKISFFYLTWCFVVWTGSAVFASTGFKVSTGLALFASTGRLTVCTSDSVGETSIV